MRRLREIQYEFGGSPDDDLDDVRNPAAEARAEQDAREREFVKAEKKRAGAQAGREPEPPEWEFGQSAHGEVKVRKLTPEDLARPVGRLAADAPGLDAEGKSRVDFLENYVEARGWPYKKREKPYDKPF